MKSGIASIKKSIDFSSGNFQIFFIGNGGSQHGSFFFFLGLGFGFSVGFFFSVFSIGLDFFNSVFSFTGVSFGYSGNTFFSGVLDVIVDSNFFLFFGVILNVLDQIQSFFSVTILNFFFGFF